MMSIVPYTAAHAARQADDLTRAIANRRDAVQGLLDARAIVRAERRKSRTHVREVFVRHGRVAQENEVVRKASLRRAPEVEDDFDERFEIREPNEPLADRQWEDVEELGHFYVR
jgi:hypothetical protein